MLKSLLQKHISPLLKKGGFRKKDMTWNKNSDDFVQVINFQRSRYSTDEMENFTMNIGLFNPKAWKTTWMKNIPTIVKEEDCFPRFRINEILNGFSGKENELWWDLKENSDFERIFIEIIQLIEYEVFPALNKMQEKCFIKKFYSSFESKLMPIEKIYLAILKNNYGEINSANHLLNEVSLASKGWNTKVKEVRKNLKKAAREASSHAGKGKPLKHSNPTKGKPHYHPTDKFGNKKPGTHYNFPK